MRIGVLALAGMIALLVVGAKPLAQSYDDPIIPRPINEASTELLAKADLSAGQAGKPTIDSMTSGNMERPAANKPAGNVPTAQPEPARKTQSGAITMPGTAFQVCYLFQHESTASREDAGGQPRPVSAVIWKAVGEGTKFDAAELRERISLHPGAPSLTAKGLYSLQTDYKVHKLSVSGQDLTHVLDLLATGDGAALAGDAVWKGKVASSIKEVEWDVERPKALRKLAAEKARAARKAAKAHTATAQSKTKSSSKQPAKATKSKTSKTHSKKTSLPKAGRSLARR